jgi:hypothetical protein
VRRTAMELSPLAPTLLQEGLQYRLATCKIKLHLCSSPSISARVNKSADKNRCHTYLQLRRFLLLLGSLAWLVSMFKFERNEQMVAILFVLNQHQDRLIMFFQIDQIQEQTSRDFEVYKTELQRVLPAFKTQLETFVAEHKVYPFAFISSSLFIAKIVEILAGCDSQRC